MSDEPDYPAQDSNLAQQPGPVISYGFPSPTLDSRLKRVEQTVQFRRRGQISPVLNVSKNKFRTVAASNLDRNGNVIFPDTTVSASTATTTANAQASGNINESQVNNLTTDLAACEKTANKGQASGYASLDSSSLVPVAQIPVLPESQITNLTTDLAAREQTANKGAASGYASLDGSALVPVAQIPPLPYTAAPVAAPATSTSSGTAGQWAYDTTFLYICIAANTWVRTALVTF